VIQKYADPDRCPYCGSEKISNDDNAFDNSTAGDFPMTCQNPACKGEFDALWRLEFAGHRVFGVDGTGEHIFGVDGTEEQILEPKGKEK